MISASEFRNGITIEKDGQVLEIIEFQHVKPGKGAAFVRTILKDIINGGVTETTFRPTEKFPQARIDRKKYQYLYRDGKIHDRPLRRSHHKGHPLQAHLQGVRRS